MRTTSTSDFVSHLKILFAEYTGGASDAVIIIDQMMLGYVRVYEINCVSRFWRLRRGWGEVG